MKIRYLFLKVTITLTLTVFAILSPAEQTYGQDQTIKHLEEIKRVLKQINSQLIRLRQITTEVDQTLLVQNQAIQKQIEGVALSHSRLLEQMMELQTESQQNIEQLLVANQKLKWVLAILVTAIVLTLLFISLKKRQPLIQSSFTEQYSHDEPPSTELSLNNSAEGRDQAAGLREMFRSRPTESVNISKTVSEPVMENLPPQSSELLSPSPNDVQKTADSLNNALPPSVSDLFSADLTEIEKTLSEVRKDFMQPVKIP